MGALSEVEKEGIRRLYSDFNRRDIDAVLARLAQGVRWANGMEGGYVEGLAAVREYWTRQFTMIDGKVEPEEISRTDDGRVAVEIHQVVRSLDGELLADERVTHLFTFNEAEITRFDISK